MHSRASKKNEKAAAAATKENGDNEIRPAVNACKGMARNYMQTVVTIEAWLGK